MMYYVISLIVSAACGWAVANMISGFSAKPANIINEQEEAESLEIGYWLAIIITYMAVNVLMVWIGLPIIPAILIGLLLIAIVVTVRNKITATMATVSMMPLAATLLFCLAKKANKAEAIGAPYSTTQKVIMVVLPIIAIFAAFIIGKIATTSNKKEKFMAFFTLWNVIAVVLAIAALIAVITLIKEVF